MKNSFLYPTTKSLGLCMCALTFSAWLAASAADAPATKPPAQPPASSHTTPLPHDKNSEWQDSSKVLPDVQYDDLPLKEVALDLKEKFPGDFDVVFPLGPGPALGENLEALDWASTQINLRLKNVKASEIFNAMNLAFESGHTPLHWELTMNGRRPTALLRIVPQEAGPARMIDMTTGLPVPAATPPAQKPMVFFVGDLIGGTNSGRMNMSELTKTIAEVCKFGLQGEHVSCYDPAQLLVVRGSEDDIRFVQSTLMALREKALLDAQKTFAREHGGSENSFWPDQWNKQRREDQPEAGGAVVPGEPKTSATNAP